jgi:hypothetical protein
MEPEFSEASPQYGLPPAGSSTPTRTQGLDIGRAFTFMFDDPDRNRKLGTGILITLIGIILSPVLIGIVPLIMMTGYTLVVLQNVMKGDRYPMPEWENYGDLFVRGLKLVVVLIVWMLPVFAIYLPSVIGAAWMDSNSDALRAMGTVLSICGTCFVILGSLAITLLMPAIYVRMAERNDISDGLAFSRIIAFTRRNLSNVLIAFLMTIVIGLIAAIAAMAGFLALCVGVLFTFPAATLWQYLATAHLYGQVGVLDEERRTEGLAA